MLFGSKRSALLKVDDEDEWVNKSKATKREASRLIPQVGGKK